MHLKFSEQEVSTPEFPDVLAGLRLVGDIWGGRANHRRGEAAAGGEDIVFDGAFIRKAAESLSLCAVNLLAGAFVSDMAVPHQNECPACLRHGTSRGIKWCFADVRPLHTSKHTCPSRRCLWARLWRAHFCSLVIIGGGKSDASDVMIQRWRCSRGRWL